VRWPHTLSPCARQACSTRLQGSSHRLLRTRSVAFSGSAALDALRRRLDPDAGPCL